MLLFVLNTHEEGKKNDVGRGAKMHLGICHCSRRGIRSLMCNSGPSLGISGVGGGGELLLGGWQGCSKSLEVNDCRGGQGGRVWPHETKVRCLENKLLVYNIRGVEK